jgi:hypothetical protein
MPLIEKMPMIRKLLTVLPVVVLPAMPARAAETQEFTGVYHISIYGLPIAESRFSSRLSEDEFRIEGTLRSAGLARIFDRTDGKTSVAGNFGSTSVSPARFALNYQSGDKAGSTEIGFENGRVVTVSVKPEHEHKGPNWVPLDPVQLAGVTDPLTATMVKAESLSSVCNRTLRVFDGEMRADIELSYLRVRPFSTEGFRGDVVDCNARFVPVAGYRKTNSSMRYLQTESRIVISFAPLGDHDVYAPVKAEVSTKIGTVRVYASRFGPAG